MFKKYLFDPKDPTNRHSFEIYDIDLSIINSIRRIILSEISIPGMIGEKDTTINIIKSNGPLHNEYLTHRIGMIPVCLKEAEIDTYEDNSIILELNVENNTVNNINVTTKNIIGKRNDKEIDKKELSEIFYPNMVTNDNILITRLRPGEYLHFTANVVKRNGKYNAAFNPVSLASFSFITDKSKITKETSILDKERAYYVDEYGDPNAIRFELEVINKYITPKYLINKAIEILIDKLNNLITKIKTNEHTVKKYNDLDNTYEYTINDEDDTLGNVIQAFIYNKFVRKNEKILDNVECTYCGYICPHPLKNILNIRITLSEQNNEKVFNDFLEYNCLALINQLETIKTEWNIFLKKD